jgi:L,D-peptidoglycan transpeptidase YkuD (ErfK/YbiS/YcfS/YnhG family)
LKGFTVTSLASTCASPARDHAVIRVGPHPRCRQQGLLHLGRLVLPCALGRSGIGILKREGDGKTPLADMRLIGGFYRPHHWPVAHRVAWLKPLPKDMGWCDAPADRNYNRAVELPYPVSHEVMARADGLYDCVLVLDWNITTRARNAGSAIFMHLARPGHAATEGCIAVSRADMARLLRLIRPGSRVRTLLQPA